MANHNSAKKRIRRNQARAEINKSRISRIRTFIKKVESAIGTGDAPAAKLALKEAQPEIMRGVSKGVLHKTDFIGHCWCVYYILLLVSFSKSFFRRRMGRRRY